MEKTTHAESSARVVSAQEDSEFYYYYYFLFKHILQAKFALSVTTLIERAHFEFYSPPRARVREGGQFSPAPSLLPL